MDKINDKYSTKNNNGTVGYMKEREKQLFRKKKQKVSRTLDNYYSPNLHSRAWWPNGLYIRKKHYGYADSGLGYYYEMNNVEQLRDIIEKQSMPKKLQKDFIEFSYLKENQFTVTIEYCSNCKEHSTHTTHSEEMYKNFATKVQKCIMLRFPFINVLLKPIDTDIVKEENYKFPKIKNGRPYSTVKIINEKFKEVRIGAMEIQICTKKKGESIPEIGLIHSKLRTGTWPKISKVLDKIVSFLPMFKGQICLYEKDDKEIDNIYDNEQEESKENTIIHSKLDGLEVNIYLLKNEKIEQLIEEANEEVESETNPKKRKDKIMLSKRIEKEYMSRPQTASLRGQLSCKSLLRHNSSIQMGKSLQRVGSASSINSIAFNNTGFAYKANNDLIDNKNAAVSKKGKFLKKKFSNEDGIVDIDPLPYDSYFIEVVESNNFMFIGMPLTFDKVLPEGVNIKKYIGLHVQEKAFLQLFVYEETKDQNGNIDFAQIGGAHVILKTCKEEDQANFLDDKDIKLEIDEKRKGQFELMVEKGRYLLEVFKEGYETVRKFCYLEKGLNNVNIEMIIEKNTNLKIMVYSFERMLIGNKEPIKNCEVVIYKNYRDIVNEGITNKEGIFKYEITKNDDFLSIIVNKGGYFRAQRPFIKNKALQSNNSNNYEEEIYFYLVKESFLKETLNYIIISYSTFISKERNFIPNFQISKSFQDNVVLSQISEEAQIETGTYGALIEYSKVQNEKTKEEENIDEQQYEEVLLLSYSLNQEQLLLYNDQEKGRSMNGLEKYCCSTFIYTPKGSFYLPAPQYAPEDFKVWNLGWLDVKNGFFFEINTILVDFPERLALLDHWIDFLQKVLDDKIYKKIFQEFQFDKGSLMNNDRYIYEEKFVKRLKRLKIFGNESQGIEENIGEIMRVNNNAVSFLNLKKKLFSNLNNFREDLEENESASFYQ